MYSWLLECQSTLYDKVPFLLPVLCWNGWKSLSITGQGLGLAPKRSRLLELPSLMCVRKLCNRHRALLWLKVTYQGLINGVIIGIHGQTLCISIWSIKLYPVSFHIICKWYWLIHGLLPIFRKVCLFQIEWSQRKSGPFRTFNISDKLPVI